MSMESGEKYKKKFDINVKNELKMLKNQKK